jgi:4'-phosphopantetheinyl transferase EntD
LLLPSLELPEIADAAHCVADIASILIDDSLLDWCAGLPALARASESRKREFVAGRQCAENAMAQLGETGRVGIRSDRSPAWPKGIVGSISHTDELVWAAVASSETTLSLGIDAEKIVDPETADELRRVVATDKEIRSLESAFESPSAWGAA